ncbi:CBL-interacting serine/threonine-protein kinase 24-like isoform X2 [Aplysia californica]|uniref:CBL-interacting serine/threonine-protein kinase 24-like isoform X2 n=1 Tax=Aplysia californica TaxID=6500 RepID=A0ABM0JWQ6_APLCA|nr:CBL-interacting serine/threonine-protein kinase 24-like isoform X2 [Aplysia californica]
MSSVEQISVIQLPKEVDVFHYNRMQYSSVLHQGQRSKILLARSEIIPDKKFAVKQMPLLSDEDRDRFSREMWLMKLASDIRGVVTLLPRPVFCGPNGYLIMPFYDKRDLLSRTGKLSDDNWMKVFVRAAVSLRSLHKKNIYHQNLRPENILLSTRHVAFISDFGAACLLSEGCDKVDTWTAAPGFRGPEADKEDGQLCPFQLDTYSLAVSMWQVLSGLCPVKNKPLDHLDNIPPQYAALLRNLLLPDPDMRWTLDKFLTEALELHPDLSCFL